MNPQIIHGNRVAKRRHQADIISATAPTHSVEYAIVSTVAEALIEAIAHVPPPSLFSSLCRLVRMCDALEGIAGVVEVAFYERIQLFGVIGRAALICAARALRPGQSGLYINVRECRAFDVPVFSTAKSQPIPRASAAWGYAFCSQYQHYSDMTIAVPWSIMSRVINAD